MLHRQRFVLTEGTSKTMPLELQQLQIDDEWRHVMHESIDEVTALNAFGMKMIVFLIATVCFLFCTLPVVIIAGRKKERALLENMQRRFVSASVLCNLY
jgi:hypothetical protein